METKIGIAVIEYSFLGKVMAGSFTPTMKIDIGADILHLLDAVPGGSVDTVKHNAEMVFANWFNKMNEIELADREEYTVESRVIACEKYANGNVRKCTLEFVFRKLDIVK